MELSQLHMHSIGKVSSVKDIGEDIIYAIPTEYYHSTQEEVLADFITETAEFETDDGVDTARADMTNSIPATWLKFNSNRVSAPDVRRDDKVMLWRVGNTDQYFWTDFNLANVKRLETVCYVWSADPDNPIAADLSNAYVLEISTHSKSITFQTSKANGEPFAYTIQLDTDEGKLVICDDVGNEIYLNSADTDIGATNADETHVSLNKQDIIMHAPDNIKAEAVNNIELECTNFKLNAKSAVEITCETSTTNCDTYTVEAKTSVNYKTQATTIDAPTTACTGHLSCASLAVGGGGGTTDGESGGGAVVKGNMNVDGSVTITQSLTAKSVQAEVGNFKTLSADSAKFGSHGPHN